MMRLRVTNDIPVAQVPNARDTRRFNFFQKGQLHQAIAAFIYVYRCMI